MPNDAAQLVARGRHPEWTLRRVHTTDDDDLSRADLEGLDDRALVDACRNGSRRAFDILVERHRRSVYLLCYRFMGTHEDAADLSQEVFLRAFRGLARFRAEAAVSTWLYRIGVNACLNRVSARPAPHVPLDDAPELPAAAADPAEGLVAAEAAGRVRAAVARLPQKQRTALVLRVYHDLSHREIAEIMGTTVGAVKANVFHALGSLRKRLGGSMT